MLREALELTGTYGIIIRDALAKGITGPAEEAKFLIHAQDGEVPAFLFMALYTVGESRKEFHVE